jgi:molybdopterin synthase catalytic subunit
MSPSILTRSVISANALAAHVNADVHGAVVTFEGVVRGEEAGARIAAIIYEAYEPMAEREIAKIVDEARARWGAAIEVRHRVGRVAVGEASLVVACGAGHRREAFEATQWVIDRIKALAPIWKTTFEAGGA